MHSAPDNTAIERRLLALAAVFITLNAAALTLSPAVRLRTWNTSLRWEHWLGVLVWVGVFTAAHLAASRRLSKRDPYLLPATALLSGWGLLTIWRLLPGFGLRQTAWLGICGMVLFFGMALPHTLGFLRRYKYVWLTASLLLTAATLLMGVNPLGYGPTMWFGVAGIYLQPSELLKLLLVAFLAAFLADRQPYLVLAAVARTPLARWLTSVLPLLAPTLMMTGAALAVLAAQRDLGTASIFLMVYAVMVYVSVGRRRILVASGLAVLGAGGLGYALYDVVRLRVDAWLNPWLDPAGRSYQIVQSLIAVANGGVSGRGPGMGSPGLVPLAHSDMIFAALAEENGLWGAAALLLLYALLAIRGFTIAMQAGDHFRRYLAAGLTTLLTGQALLIIAGNLRLLPLTGVTLPFVSYGGSSLLTSFIAVLLLLHISHRPEPLPARLYAVRPYLVLGGLFLLGLTTAAFSLSWWSVVRGPALLDRTDNQRRSVADRYVLRGALLDRNEQALSHSVGEPGEYTRILIYPSLSSLIGYNDPTYGQAGLEAGLDGSLRGLEGQPALRVLGDRLLYGQPPPGLDVRLSLDLDKQKQADDALGQHAGAIVWLDATSGEILALASHPTFDANRLAEDWEKLVADPRSPLVNRAVQGRYPAGSLSQSLFAGDPNLLRYDPFPELPLPSYGYAQVAGDQMAGTSPLQAALQAAALINAGQRPTPLLALSRRLPQGGWTNLDEPLPAKSLFSPAQAAALLSPLTRHDRSWGALAMIAPATGDSAVWFVGGSLPDNPGPAYAIAILLEEDNASLAEAIFNQLINP
jgi:cell division protein FtsW (lipid II flippase)